LSFETGQQSYNSALAAVGKAEGLLRNAKIPYSRPNDYYAEMVKTDGSWCPFSKK
jgi:hypothetical protein